MAKYTIEAGCGHTVEQQLYGPERERVRRLEWMRSSSGKCNACYAALKHDEERSAIEQRVQQLTLQLLGAIDAAPDPAAALAALQAQVGERMRLAPAAAGNEPRMIAALRVLSERGQSA